MAGSKILVVEDDQNLLDVLEYNLKQEGYEVFKAADGVQALEAARSSNPDLVILDVMLPKMSGFEVCRILRKETTVPILMLTAKIDEVDKIVGLEIGADDYMTKPFSMRELLARVRAMLRRTKMVEKPLRKDTFYRVGNLEINTGRRQVTLNGKLLGLAPKEFELLAFLAENKGLVFSREQLLEKIWGYDYVGNTRTVDVHVRWLRQKIEAMPGKPKRLITVRGSGYKLED